MEVAPSDVNVDTIDLLSRQRERHSHDGCLHESRSVYLMPEDVSASEAELQALLLRKQDWLVVD